MAFEESFVNATGDLQRLPQLVQQRAIGRQRRTTYAERLAKDFKCFPAVNQRAPHHRVANLLAPHLGGDLIENALQSPILDPEVGALSFQELQTIPSDSYERFQSQPRPGPRHHRTAPPP
jgi:hypothetical protein